MHFLVLKCISAIYIYKNENIEKTKKWSENNKLVQSASYASGTMESQVLWACVILRVCTIPCYIGQITTTLMLDQIMKWIHFLLHSKGEKHLWGDDPGEDLMAEYRASFVWNGEKETGWPAKMLSWGVCFLPEIVVELWNNGGSLV